MRYITPSTMIVSFSLLLLPLYALSHTSNSRMPENIDAPGEKLILVDPHIHAWGAYTPDGRLVRSGLASAGKDWCPDMDRECHTETGTFRIYHVEGSECISERFPIPTGGAPMPYCMYFNGNQALHGSPNVVYGNISHGCVRVHVSDAKWIRYNFIDEPDESSNSGGTLVTVLPY